MKKQRKNIWVKMGAVMLAATLGLAPAAQALTPDQFKELLSNYYLDTLPEKIETCQTIPEILDTLQDPYTAYMTAQEYAAFTSSMEDKSVVGIGITAVADEAGLCIASVLDGSPAQKAGLVSGDVIIEVSGKSAAGQQSEVITSWLKGEEGTEVSCVVRHEDGTTQRYTMKRAQVLVPATSVQLLEDGTTGYINCTTFGSETSSQVRTGTETYPEASAWIVDLRSNGGGDVYSVSQTLGVFLGAGNMVYLRNGSGTYYRYVSEQTDSVMAPVIVLTSGQTASSAEIFGLGVKDKDGGLVIGGNTYGKGVAQIILTGKEFPEYLVDGEAVKITAYQYFGTSGTTANRIGVVPDLLVADQDADEIAQLLHTTEPGVETAGWLRIRLGGWRWYVNLEEASGQENGPYFTELLEALYPDCDLYLGIGEEQWQKTTAAQVAETQGLTAYTPRTFSDVTGTEYETAIQTLATYDMLRGYGDGTYRADGTLTRAELCAMLVQTLHLKQSQTRAEYTDVAAESWYEPCVSAVCAAGYMNGVGDEKFEPNGTVTNEQMATVIGRVAADLNTYYDLALEKVPEEKNVPDSFSTWAQPWVWLLSWSQSNVVGNPLNMLYAEPANIAPKASATRGQTAQVLYNVLVSISVLPI